MSGMIYGLFSPFILKRISHNSKQLCNYLQKNSVYFCTSARSSFPHVLNFAAVHCTIGKKPKFKTKINKKLRKGRGNWSPGMDMKQAK